MNSAIELKKYKIIEYLMNLTDITVLEKVENIIIEKDTISVKEIKKRALISEKELENKQTKTHEEAVHRLNKWLE